MSRLALDSSRPTPYARWPNAPSPRRDHPGDAEAIQRALAAVSDRWARDWVTSFMGGEGGTAIWEDPDRPGTLLVCDAHLLPHKPRE